MSTETWPKAGKKPGRPGTEVKMEEQKLGSPYFHRQTILSGNRERELNANDYGKKEQKDAKVTAGVRVNPRRSIITGASPKEPGDPKLPY